MTARASRRMAADERGVSAVVGAVLVLALFTTAFSVWAFQTLPEWEADHEETHQRAVVSGLSALKADVQGLSVRGEAGPVTRAIDLGATPVPLLQGVKATGAIGLRSGVSASAAFSGPEILLLDGKPTATPSDSVDGAQLDSVDGLQALTVAIASDRVTSPTSSAWVRATATDGITSVSATVSHVGAVAGCQGAGLTVAVTSTTTTASILLCGLDNHLPATPVDLLTDAYGFRGALTRLSTPYTLTLSQGVASGASVQGTYMAAWTDAAGLEHAVGTGLSLPFALDVDGSALQWEPGYVRFTDQVASWELGGIVLDQGDGEVVADAPGFALKVADGQGYLQWTLMDLDGGAGQVAGTHKATVSVTHRSTSDALLRVDGLGLTLLTEHADAWASFLGDRLLLAEAGGAATVATDGSSLTLTLATGPALPVTQGWLLHLRIIHADVAVS